MIYNLYKQRGETPLECIQRFRHDLMKQKSFDKSEDRWTYLGRLDPMAEGVLLVATGADTAQINKEKFLSLDKEYEFSVLFGFATDTYDVLGKILRVEKVLELGDMELIRICKIYEGEREQKYPPYSSKMQQWNKKDASANVEEAESAAKNVNIYELKFLGLSRLTGKNLFGRLLMDISKVKGDFRQHDILTLWKQMLTGMQKTEIIIGRFSARVSSGTYIRGIVNDFGNTLGCGACALTITRTQVGDYKIGDSVV